MYLSVKYLVDMIITLKSQYLIYPIVSGQDVSLDRNHYMWFSCNNTKQQQSIEEVLKVIHILVKKLDIISTMLHKYQLLVLISILLIVDIKCARIIGMGRGGKIIKS